MNKLLTLILLFCGCENASRNPPHITNTITRFVPLDTKLKKPIHEFAYSAFYKDQLYGSCWEQTKALYELRIAGIYDGNYGTNFISFQYLKYNDSELLILGKGNIFWPSLTEPMDSIKIEKFSTTDNLDLMCELRASLNVDYSVYQAGLDQYPEPMDGNGYLEIEEIMPKVYKSFIFQNGSLDQYKDKNFMRINRLIKELEADFNVKLLSP